MTIVLGIDPGSRITGYGIVHQEDYKIGYLSSGCILTKVDTFPIRLKLIYIEISKIIKTFNPDCFVIEEVFVSKNANSALKLGHARGAAIVAAMNYGLPVFEYAARQVKQAVVGSGAAKKSQVQNMVRILLKLSDIPKVDAADALAIAITYCHSKYKKFNFKKK